MTVTEALLQITELTQQNLQILQVLNDSFYTKSNHLTTQVGDTTYTIPSYIALENKVNHIQDAFNNLVHSAQSGDAWFNIDGNSREINVRGYQTAPNPIQLTVQNIFKAEDKYAFKDMLTPQPYLNFDMSDLPDDINTVVVKKFIPYSQSLQKLLTARTPQLISDDSEDASALLSYAEVLRCLGSGDRDFVPGVDYLEYDSTYTLPVRKNMKSGTYVVEEVISDKINSDLQNIITVKIHKDTPLIAKGYDGIQESDVQAGDMLVTWDGSAKLEIISVKKAARQLELRVVSGEYVNVVPCEDVTVPANSTLLDEVSDYSKFRFYSTSEDPRELHVPLEEDDMVYIVVAPLNTRINTQSEWGEGLLVNVDRLKLDNTDASATKFRDYYNDNVLNLGDAIIEFATIMFPAITKFDKDQVISLTTLAPVMEDDDLQVVQINKHLNDSDTVKNIRSLYSQKKQYQIDLNEIQSKIQSLNDDLSQISFDDMSGIRSAYTAQIADLKEQQNTITTSINKIIDDIANSANNAEVPIEDAKFRARGFVNVESFLERVASAIDEDVDTLRQYVLGVQCKYRYKNPDIPQANVSVIKDFLFTEWVEYNPPIRERTMSYSNGSYQVYFTDLADGKFNSSANDNKFNQLDIPISQGEMVEYQVRVLWGFGYPFVKVTSGWSELYEIDFPPELVKDVQVTTIIEENNSDIETNRFETILQTKGITEHVDDQLQDQDVVYFHRPENIASGFYTTERRVIPLRDKLQDLHNSVVSIQDMLEGTTSTALSVNVVVDNISNLVQPDIENVIQLPAYNQVPELENNVPTGSSYKKDDVVYLTGVINITNTTEHSLNIFSMFPGARDMAIDNVQHTWVNDKAPFSGIGIVWQSAKTNGKTTREEAQKCNQIITYTKQNPFDKSMLGHDGVWDMEYERTHNDDGELTDTTPGLHFYPLRQNEYSMCMDADSTNAKYTIAPGASISFPISFEYILTSSSGGGKAEDTFKVGFNIRNSLYQDPLYYQINFVAKYNQTTLDALNSAKASVDSLTKYNVTVR